MERACPQFVEGARLQLSVVWRKEHLHLSLVYPDGHLSRHGDVIRAPVHPYKLDEVRLHVAGLLKRVRASHQSITDIPFYDVLLQCLERVQHNRNVLRLFLFLLSSIIVMKQNV